MAWAYVRKLFTGTVPNINPPGPGRPESLDLNLTLSCIRGFRRRHHHRSSTWIRSRAKINMKKEFSYHNGYYDDIEKTFRGFEQVEVIEHGDATAPTSVTTHGFFTGGPDGVDNDNDGNIDEVSDHGYHEEAALKGNLHTLEVRAQDNVLFSREINNWQVRNLALSQDNMEVRLAYNLTNEKQIYEGLGTSEILQVTYEYDDFGNVIKEYNLGALSITGDELFTHTEYINDTDLWILGKPKRHWRTDAGGQQVSEQFNYYDGDAYSGLPLGDVEKGNLTRQEGWVAQGHLYQHDPKRL